MYSSSDYAVLVFGADHSVLAALLDVLNSLDQTSTVRQVQTVRAAAGATASEQYDIICYDLMTPGEPMLEQVNELRELAPDTPMIALVASDDELSGLQAMRLGVHDYVLPEELTPAHLARVLRKTVTRHRGAAHRHHNQVKYHTLFDDVFDSTAVGFLVLNATHQIIWCNSTLMRYLGFERAEIIGESLQSFLGKFEAECFDEPAPFIAQLLDDYEKEIFNSPIECYLPATESRDELWLQYVSHPIETGEIEGGRIAYFVDISDQKRLERSTNNRHRLARELHDSISQTLFTCQAMSESALRRLKKSPKRAVELMQLVNTLATQALGEMHTLLLELRPNMMEQMTFKALLKQYLQVIQYQRNLEVSLRVQVSPPLPIDLKYAFYRIAQEALSNIGQHAQATVITVKLVESQTSYILTIHDNGVGFEQDKMPPGRLGVGNMRLHAQQIGAQIDIVSGTNQGTSITVTCPKVYPGVSRS